MTSKSYLIIFGLIVATAFTSCKKEDESTPPAEADKPVISLNASASGNIIDIPQNALEANNGAFNSVVSNVNQVSAVIAQLNDIPENATTTSRSTNSEVTYNWTFSNSDGMYEIWYTVNESEIKYDVTYEISLTVDGELTIPRTEYISGWVLKNGKDGYLTYNLQIFNTSTPNYTFSWDTNLAGDLHVLSTWSNTEDSYYTNIIYETTVYAAGNGETEYKYTSDEDNIVWHYEWNADWSVITWTYSVNGEVDEEQSGEWTA